jgi:hypothetical protein
MTTEYESVQPPPKTQSTVERMRAYRRHRRCGLRCAKVRFGRVELDGLVQGTCHPISAKTCTRSNWRLKTLCSMASVACSAKS